MMTPRKASGRFAGERYRAVQVNRAGRPALRDDARPREAESVFRMYPREQETVFRGHAWPRFLLPRAFTQNLFDEHTGIDEARRRCIGLSSTQLLSLSLQP